MRTTFIYHEDRSHLVNSFKRFFHLNIQQPPPADGQSLCNVNNWTFMCNCLDDLKCVFKRTISKMFSFSLFLKHKDASRRIEMLYFFQHLSLVMASKIPWNCNFWRPVSSHLHGRILLTEGLQSSIETSVGFLNWFGVRD